MRYSRTFILLASLAIVGCGDDDSSDTGDASDSEGVSDGGDESGGGSDDDSGGDGGAPDDSDGGVLIAALRTPDERFADLPGYPFEPNYVTVDPGALQ